MPEDVAAAAVQVVFHAYGQPFGAVDDRLLADHGDGGRDKFGDALRQGVTEAGDAALQVCPLGAGCVGGVGFVGVDVAQHFYIVGRRFYVQLVGGLRFAALFWFCPAHA